MDKAKKLELFGSDSEDEDEDEAVEAPTPASGEAQAADEEEEDLGENDNLFGSEDEGDEEEQAAPAANSGDPLSYSLPTMPRPPADAELFLVRLPNILQFQPRPFDPETFEDEDGAEDEESGKARAENVVRWRETAAGERQSNARLVNWSDGSMTLHVGREVLLAQQVKMPDGSTHLYTKHPGTNLECHGILKQKITLAPASRHSKTHQELTQKIARVHHKPTKMKQINTVENPAAKQEERERAYDEAKKLKERQASKRARNEDRETGLTADFLDMDDDDDGEPTGNLGAIRKQFKERRQRPAGRPVGKRPAGGGKRMPAKRRRSYDGSDDDDDGEDLDEDDEEEEDDGDPAEMDGFIVGDEDEDEEDDDEEEAVSSEEERRPKKKGKRGRSLVDDDDDDD